MTPFGCEAIDPGLVNKDKLMGLVRQGHTNTIFDSRVLISLERYLGHLVRGVWM